MESLLNDNYIFLYLIVLVMFLKPEKLEDNQKIYIVYLVTFLVDILNKIQTAWILSIAIIVLFLYVEYLDNSNFKRDVMVKMLHKIVDFFYIMISQYSVIKYIILVFLNTSPALMFGRKVFGIYSSNIIYIIQFILIIWITDSIFGLSWKIKMFDQMQKEIESVSKIYNLSNNLNEDRFRVVLLLEDKSYFKRTTLGTIFSISYLKDYFFPKVYKSIKRHFTNIKDQLNIKKLNVKKIRESKKRKFRQYLRGHSTIEAQLIRSIGIEKGYIRNKNIIKRKLFEIIYSKLVFSNLEKYYIKNHYNNSHRMKDYLLYVYLHKARVEIKGKKCIGLHKLFKKRVDELDDNELFIGTLSFSKYNLSLDDILKYRLIYNLNLNIEDIKKVYNEI